MQIIEQIIQSLTMPTETFAFIKEEPEARQIMNDYMFENINDLCEKYINSNIQIKKRSNYKFTF